MIAKKGMTMTMSVIVVAVVVVVVLIVSLSMFRGSAKSFNEDLTACDSSGGFCAKYCNDGFISLPFECGDARPACCQQYQDFPDIEIIEGDLF